MKVKKQQLECYIEQLTGSKLGKEYNKPVYCQPVYLTYMQSAVHGVVKSWTQLSDFTFTFHFHELEKEMATYSSVLAWRIPDRRSLMGCHLWGCTESDTTEVI